MANRPYMIDIYQGDEVSDDPTPLAGLERVKANQIAFLYHKATQSVARQDSRMVARSHAWLDGSQEIHVIDVDGAPLVLPPRIGFYHFNGPLTNVAAEVANFVTQVRKVWSDWLPGRCAVCFDWEEWTSGHSVSAVAADGWCSRVEDEFGVSCDVYGGNSPREAFQVRGIPPAVTQRMAGRNLWFCEYVAQPYGIPEPWQDGGVIWWQDDGDKYGPGPHTIPGMIGLCDNSTVTGGVRVATAAALWGKATPGGIPAAA